MGRIIQKKEGTHTETVQMDTLKQTFNPNTRDENTSLSTDEFSWTEEEEKNLVKKLDFKIMTLLMLGFFALQLDRGNIGNALTDFFLHDVKITQAQYNIGQQLVAAGTLLLEIPSNYILYRVGPSTWLSGQIIAWGLLSTFQAFQKGLGAFLTTRLLLGLCESGFIPGGLYIITRWYKRDETTKRIAWFYVGGMVAQASTGLIAYGVLRMRGTCGLTGWQWLFLIEGMFTVLVGILFLCLFPRSPADPMSLLGKHDFTEREATILLERVLRDDPTKQHGHIRIKWAELKAALLNWTVYPHLIMTILGRAPYFTLIAYAPSLVNSFGYGRLTSNALVSIANWAQILINVSWAMLADKWNRRGPLVLAGLTMWWAFALASQQLVESQNDKARYAMLALAIAFSGVWHSIDSAWVSLNSHTAGERSITFAMLIMSANISGIIGPQFLQPEDAPEYRVGWTIIVITSSVAIIVALLANLQYWLLNKRTVQKGTGVGWRYNY